MKKFLFLIIALFSMTYVQSVNATVSVNPNPLKNCYYHAGSTQIFEVYYDNNTHNAFVNNVYIWVRVAGTVYGPMSPFNVTFDNLTGGWKYEYDALANGFSIPTPLDDCVDITYHWQTTFVEPYPGWDNVCECDNTDCDASFFVAGSNSLNLGVVPLNCDPGYTYDVDFGNGTIWSMSHPYCVGFSYTYPSPGLYTICVTATNGAVTCKKCRDVCVNEEIDYGTSGGYGDSKPAKSTSIKNAQSSLGIDVYPVPADKSLNIDLQLIQADNFELLLTDMNGKTIITDKFNAEVGRSTQSINVENLPAGVYTIKLRGEKQTITKKVTVK